jgi:hypothetical protein
MREFSLAEVGVETVGEASARKGWAPKTIQNWIARGLIRAKKVGPARGVLLVLIAEVDAFEPPVREDRRGRPLTNRKPRAPKKSAPRKGRG